MSDTPTREQILAEPAGPTLDRLVAAHVLGYRFDGDTLTDGHRCWPIPEYSADIAAAWELVEKRSSSEFRFMLVRYRDGWFCEFRERGIYGDIEPLIATTAPLAICRAALLATLLPREADPG